MIRVFSQCRICVAIHGRCLSLACSMARCEIWPQYSTLMRNSRVFYMHDHIDMMTHGMALGAAVEAILHMLSYFWFLSEVLVICSF